MKNERKGSRFPHSLEREIIRFIVCGLIGALMLTSYSICAAGDQPKQQVDYELQERCGVMSSKWAKQHGEVVDYQSYYNKKQNKCVVYATLFPIKSDNIYSSYYMVYDPNTNETLAQYTIRTGPNYEDRICILSGKSLGWVSEEKWKNIVKELLGK